MKRIAAPLLIALLSLAAGAQTNDPQALVQRGRDAITHGEPEKAVELFEKAVAMKPNNADYHYRLANATLQAGIRASMFRAMSMLPGFSGPRFSSSLRRDNLVSHFRIQGTA